MIDRAVGEGRFRRGIVEWSNGDVLTISYLPLADDAILFSGRKGGANMSVRSYIDVL